MMKRELKEKMENVKVWVCNHKKVVGTAAAVLLTIAVVGGAVYAVNAPVGVDKAVAKTEQRKDSRLDVEQKKEEKKAEEKKAEEKKDAEEKKQEKEKSDKEKEKKQEKKTDNAAVKQTKENTATSSTVTNSGSASSSFYGSSQEQPAPESAPSQQQSNQSEPSSQPSKQEQPAQSQPSQPSKQEQPAPEPEKPVHTHNWQPQYKEGQKWVDTSHEESYEVYVGNQSGLEIQGDPNEYLLNNTNGDSGWHNEVRTKWVDEGHYEPTQELTGYKCSCGATK